jgi:hypothetical protein
MRIVSYKVAALVAVLTLGFIPLNAALGAGWLHVVAFGDSLLDAGTYSLFAEATFGGGRFTTNPTSLRPLPFVPAPVLGPSTA